MTQPQALSAAVTTTQGRRGYRLCTNPACHWAKTLGQRHFHHVNKWDFGGAPDVVANPLPGWQMCRNHACQHNAINPRHYHPGLKLIADHAINFNAIPGPDDPFLAIAVKPLPDACKRGQLYWENLDNMPLTVQQAAELAAQNVLILVQDFRLKPGYVTAKVKLARRDSRAA